MSVMRARAVVSAAVGAVVAAGLTGCAGPSGSAGSAAGPAPAIEASTAGHESSVDFEKVERKRAKLATRGPKRTDQPQEAMEYFLRQRLAPGMDAYPIDHVQRVAREMRAAEARRRNRGPQPLGGPGLPGGLESWREIGPGNIGGRTRAIAIEPPDPKQPDAPLTMYAAGVAGGVFKSTDGGETWAPTSDFLTNIAFTTLTMDPTDPSVIYGGTGEGFFNGDAVRGLGIFKTEDAGQTWEQLPGTRPPQVPEAAFHYVNKIQISPTDPSRIYAATRFGVWRSTDAGASWQLVLANANQADGLNNAGISFVGATDLQIRTDRQPGDPDVLFAAFGSFIEDGLYRSVDGGDTWQRLGTTGDVDRVDQGRMTIAIAPSDQDTLYVAMADSGGAMLDVYRSTDGGDTWEGRLDFSNEFSELLFSNVPFGNGCFGNSSFAQGWYDNIIAVDPADPDVVWVGGIDLFRSDDGGRNFEVASYWYFSRNDPSFVHADQHEIVFHPSFDGETNTTMFVGNDGGVFRTDNARAQASTNGCPPQSGDPLPAIEWRSLNNGYGVTQYYHGDSSKQNPVFIGGTQDNGTSRALSTTDLNGWQLVLGGDGGYVQIDPNNDQIVLAETQNFPTIFKSTQGGDPGSFDPAVEGITDSDGLFITPFFMDQTEPSVVWTGGRRAWRTTNQASSWQLASDDFENADLGLDPSRISAIASAPGEPSVVYLGFSNGFIATSTNALATPPEDIQWSIRADGLPIENGFISDLAVDPDDPQLAYATSSTFGIPHIYRTTDGGQTWESIDGIADNAIPDIPVHSIAVLPSDSSILFAGTEVGVFASEDAGQTWVPASTGLPTTVVEELDFKDSTTLVAFTHGRGAFITDGLLCPADLTGPGGDGVPDGTLTSDDFFFYLGLFADGDPAADLTGPGGDGVPDGNLTSDDFFFYLGLFAQGCP